MPNRSILSLGAVTAVLLALSNLGTPTQAQPLVQRKPAVMRNPQAESKPVPDVKTVEGETKPAAWESEATLSDSEKSILERIRNLKTSLQWRRFGPCRYDWGAWRLSEGGVHSTGVACGDPPTRASVAVHCDTLRIARRRGNQAWQPWRLPLAIGESKESGGEDLMVATLCANLKLPPEIKPVEPGVCTESAAEKAAAQAP